MKSLAGSKARFALIDADSILYAVALQSEAISKGSGPAGEDEVFQVKDGAECYREVVSKLEGLVQEVGAEGALICLTPPGKCYRYSLLASYKANRATYRRPEVLVPLQALVAERRPFGVLAVRGLEADDICGITSTSLQKANLREPVIVSIDKDMLQIPGLNYSPMTAARTGTIGQLREITAFEGERMHLYQTLIGDTVDNYTGCPGIGPRKAARLLDGCVEAHGELCWDWIVEAFRKKGLSEEYALTQARVARILRDTDWDPKSKEVKLWLPPSAYGQLSHAEKTTDTIFASAHKDQPSPQPSLISKALQDAPTKVILSERKWATLH